MVAEIWNLSSSVNIDIERVSAANEWDIEWDIELYKHTDDGVFDDFPKISDHLPKISEDFSNCPEDQTNVPEHFPKISENFRRFPKIAEQFRGRPEDVSMIHQRIYVQFKRQTWCHWNYRYRHM